MLTDYKLFCFSGKVEFCYVSEGSHTSEQRIQFFDRNFNPLHIVRSDYMQYDILPRKPRNWNAILCIAEKLAGNIPHVRVDFYVAGQRIYFGEFTFYTGSGYIPFVDTKWDYSLGEFLNLYK